MRLFLHLQFIFFGFTCGTTGILFWTLSVAKMCPTCTQQACYSGKETDRQADRQVGGTTTNNVVTLSLWDK